MEASARPRLLLQYLEPSPAVDTVDPALVGEQLGFALERLPVTDLALGWDLRPELVEAVRSALPPDVVLWRWVPVFTDSGTKLRDDSHVAVGPGGLAPPPFRDMADFRFLCIDHDEVIDAGLARSVELAHEVDADGVLLDRIRWHSPSQSPADELTCFCDRSQRASAVDGLDLSRVASELRAMAGSLDGRQQLVRALLGSPAGGVLAEFLAWRSLRVTSVVGQLVDGLHRAGLRSALDVFTPALARSVGQDLAMLADSASWAKSMTYFDALGPAAMPFELGGYAAWLEDAGEDDAVSFLAGLLGFKPPGLTGADAHIEALQIEMSRLADAAGKDRAIVGIDAVEDPGICEVNDHALDARVSAIGRAGLGIAPCWELLSITTGRLERIARAWSGEA
jgi:hypothetical protein